MAKKLLLIYLLAGNPYEILLIPKTVFNPNFSFINFTALRVSSICSWELPAVSTKVSTNIF